MGLDERVATLERQMTAVREVDIPTLCSEMEKKYRDVLIETRGWAEIAVKTSHKVDSMSEMLNRMYDETTGGLRKVNSRLDKMDSRFDAMDSRFDAMDKRIDAMDKRIDGIDKRIDGIDGTLADHGKLLVQILAKLS